MDEIFDDLVFVIDANFSESEDWGVKEDVNGFACPHRQIQRQADCRKELVAICEVFVGHGCWEIATRRPTSNLWMSVTLIVEPSSSLIVPLTRSRATTWRMV